MYNSFYIVGVYIIPECRTKTVATCLVHRNNNKKMYVIKTYFDVLRLFWKYIFIIMLLNCMS